MGALTPDEEKLLVYAERYLREFPDFATGFKLIALVRSLAVRLETYEDALREVQKDIARANVQNVIWPDTQRMIAVALRAPTAPREAAAYVVTEERVVETTHNPLGNYVTSQMVYVAKVERPTPTEITGAKCEATGTKKCFALGEPCAVHGCVINPRHGIGSECFCPDLSGAGTTPTSEESK